MRALSATGISFHYGTRTVLDQTCLHLNRGEVVALLGPNGVGKTTLLKVLAGIMRAHAGHVLVDGSPIEEWSPATRARTISYVPQIHTSSFPFRVLDVVMMGRFSYQSFLGQYSEVDRRAALRALSRLSLEHLQDRPYTQISGGERQLVLIARALAQEAAILILDEPLTGLDYGHQLRFLTHLRELAEQRLAVLFSTHMPDHALISADRAYLLENGNLRIHGTPRAVITAGNIQRLYGATVQLVAGPYGTFLCAPKLSAPACCCGVRTAAEPHNQESTEPKS